jgi:hypothetical protein
LKSGSSPVFASGYVRLAGFGVFLMFCPRPLRKQRAAILNRQPATSVPIGEPLKPMLSATGERLKELCASSSAKREVW